MKLFLILFLWPAIVSATLTRSDCGTEARRPRMDDIEVLCGTTSITLLVQLCPVIYTGYNETHLIMNSIESQQCKASIDMSVSPPVAKFTFPLNSTNACGSTFRYTSDLGTGIFADFSNIQTVNISGIIRSKDYVKGTITYNAELKYFYSCAYPLEYLVNNTQVDVSGSSVSITDRNGTFLSTLTMRLFKDIDYTIPFLMPAEGVELRRMIYVEVRAINLTAQYHVLLDRCYASISPLPANSSYFNLFVPCSQDQFTNIITNGASQIARFYFPAFRFHEQENEMVSTYYLHCITRLCDRSTCFTFMQCNDRRRKRDIEELDPNSVYTLTSSEIITKPSSLVSTETEDTEEDNDSSVGLAVAVGVLASVCVIGIIVGAVLYKKLRY